MPSGHQGNYTSLTDVTPGGWSACLEVRSEEGVRRIVLRGGAPETTNNIMELCAAVNGLAHALEICGPGPSRIRLRTDSEYVQEGLRDWSRTWKRNGWKTAAGEPVKNRETWEVLCDLRDRADSAGEFHLEHVRGHSGDPGNEAADKAAVSARDLSRSRSLAWKDTPEQIDPSKAGEDREARLRSSATDFEAEASARGYRRYLDPFHRDNSRYLFSMQLRVTKGADTLYFLNVDAWDMGAENRRKANLPMLEASVQFRTEDDQEGAHVNVSTPLDDFEKTERFFQRMWREMGFGRYERSGPDPAPMS